MNEIYVKDNTENKLKNKGRVSNSGTFYLVNALNLNKLPTISLTNEEKVGERIDFYFKSCIDGNVKPTIPGLALALGINKKTFESIVDETETERTIMTYFNGKAIPTTIRNMFIKAKSVMNVLIEDYLVNGKVNPISGIFIAKNNFGYKDSQEVVVSPQREEILSSDELINEALNLPKK